MFTATTTRSMLVTVPRSIPIKQFEIGHTGEGRVHGWLLQELNVPRSKAVFGDGGMFDACTKRGCDGRDIHAPAWLWNVDDFVPAGLYRLTVIADGAPVTVRVVANNLRGRMRAFPNDRVEAEIATLTPTPVDAAGSDNVYSAGDFSNVGNGRPDYTLLGAWAIGPPQDALNVAQSCGYYKSKTPDPPQQVAFAPGCPLEEDGLPPHVVQGRGFLLMRTGPQGPYGQGAWYATSADVQKHGAVALWLDFGKR